jgi:lipoprotein
LRFSSKFNQIFACWLGCSFGSCKIALLKTCPSSSSIGIFLHPGVQGFARNSISTKFVFTNLSSHKTSFLACISIKFVIWLIIIWYSTPSSIKSQTCQFQTFQGIKSENQKVFQSPDFLLNFSTFMSFSGLSPSQAVKYTSSSYLV